MHPAGRCVLYYTNEVKLPPPRDQCTQGSSNTHRAREGIPNQISEERACDRLQSKLADFLWAYSLQKCQLLRTQEAMVGQRTIGEPILTVWNDTRDHVPSKRLPRHILIHLQPRESWQRAVAPRTRGSRSYLGSHMGARSPAQCLEISHYLMTPAQSDPQQRRGLARKTTWGTNRGHHGGTWGWRKRKRLRRPAVHTGAHGSTREHNGGTTRAPLGRRPRG